MLKAAPRNTRELFVGMGDDPLPDSMESYIRQFDWSNSTVHNIYCTFLNRMPESAEAVRRASNVNCDTRALSSIAGEEFRKRIVELVLTAYPEKQRLIHIHIPKTAGSDLRDGLATVLPVIHYNYSIPAVYPSAALLVQLARAARRAQSADRILVTGHTSLEWYFARGLCRPTDRIFAVVREPKASLMSAVNYYLRRIREDPECKSGDTRSWAIKMNVDRFDPDMDVEALRELGKSILDNEAFTRGILATTMLGRGDYESALDLIIRSNIELIPLEVYEEWLREQWGINSTKANESPKVLRLADLDEGLNRRIDAQCEQDYMLHKRIMNVWARVGGTRVFGVDLL